MTSSSSGGQNPQGVASGSLIAIMFGLVFIIANSGRLGDAWTLGVRVAGVLCAVVLVVAVLRLHGRGLARAGADREDPARDGAGRSPFAGRPYLLLVGAEAVALFGGLFVLNQVLDLHTLNIAWIAFVVGAHFFVLGRIWNLPRFHVLGGVLIVLAAAGPVLSALDAPVVWIDVVSGVFSGVALFAAVVFALVQQARADEGDTTGSAARS
ncbi:hypothetical protein [Actinorugispora endophytica]|nr:hypothetical protein [Actinorugispora endophytica]